MSELGNFRVLLLFPFEILYLWIYALLIRFRDLLRMIFPGRPKSLQGEIILITGGANGIGQKLSFKIAEKEKRLTIVIWDVNDQANAETVAKLRVLGLKNVFAFKVDVSDREQVAIAAEKVRKEIGDVTILFNNAGILGNLTAGWKEDPKIFEKVFAVNVFSHSWTLREFLPKMIEKGKGHVVATSSVFGFMPAPSASAYSASKFAVRGFMESLKEDLRHHPKKPKILFSTVYPDLVTTNMTAAVDLRIRRYKFLHSPMSPEHVANEILRGVLLENEHIYIPRLHRFSHFLLDMNPPEAMRKLFDLSGMPVLHAEDDNNEGLP